MKAADAITAEAAQGPIRTTSREIAAGSMTTDDPKAVRPILAIVPTVEKAGPQARGLMPNGRVKAGNAPQSSVRTAAVVHARTAAVVHDPVAAVSILTAVAVSIPMAAAIPTRSPNLNTEDEHNSNLERRSMWLRRFSFCRVSAKLGEVVAQRKDSGGCAVR